MADFRPVLVHEKQLARIWASRSSLRPSRRPLGPRARHDPILGVVEVADPSCALRDEQGDGLLPRHVAVEVVHQPVGVLLELLEDGRLGVGEGDRICLGAGLFDLRSSEAADDPSAKSRRRGEPV